MKSETTKEQFRTDLDSRKNGLQKTLSGKMAEILRKEDIYTSSVRVYCGPSILLKQIRINTLLDGKELVMPGPGMKEGFYLIKPYAVPFKKMALAVTYKGLSRYGKRLDNSDLKKLGIDLLIDHVAMADRAGYFLGDGKGFFDLAVAVLGDTGALEGGFDIISAVDDPEKIVAELPRDPWDIQSNYILSPAGIKGVSERGGKTMYNLGETQHGQSQADNADLEALCRYPGKEIGD